MSGTRRFVLNKTQLCWLLASLFLVAAPHIERIPWWESVVSLGLAAWAYTVHLLNWRAPDKYLRLAITIALMVGVGSYYHSLFGLHPGVAMLVVLSFLKLLEMYSMRDVRLVLFLSYFLVAANFFYSQTPLLALFVIIDTLIITATLVMFSDKRGQAGTLGYLRKSRDLVIQALPMMLILFVLFPRIPGPLWGLPKDAGMGITGLSNSMSPGSISHLSQSNAVAFRVRFKGEVPPREYLYWRGPVFWYFDGTIWTPGRKIKLTKTQIGGDNDPPLDVEYNITIEPHGERWVFALDIPVKVPDGVDFTPDLRLVSRDRIINRKQYEMQSVLDFRGTNISDVDYRRALQVPRDQNPRARKLAEQWRSEKGNDNEIVEAAMRYFREQPFFYTLQPPLLGEDRIDSFLFGSRRGFCEHYASAFVYLMRAAGIPARVVTGYMGGQMNPVSDYMIIYQSDAHAWAEVWIKNYGWKRVDPTGAVAPERIEYGLQAALPASDSLPVFIFSNNQLIRQLRYFLDNIRSDWNQWLLGYNNIRQKAFLSELGFSNASWGAMTIWLTVLSAMLMGIVALWLFRRQLLGPHDAVVKAYARFSHKLASIGLDRKANEGPLDYARRILKQRPDLDAPVSGIIRLYIRLRYESGSSDKDLHILKRSIKLLRV
ncbi:MAG: protein-glutamine gamma-glutamyltransferase TgpA [Gammaproteobacteria bacterium]|nr:MAG: protein-glutamine gamma-glutamyltransferase TgpA [Gammaproteobacteria bacterium]